jgi:hypothetical protein
MNAVEKSVRIIQFSDPTHRYSSQASGATSPAEQNNPSAIFPVPRELPR